MLKRQLVLLLKSTIVVHFINELHAVFDLGHFGVGDPFDMTVAQLTFEHGFGITHAS